MGRAGPGTRAGGIWWGRAGFGTTAVYRVRRLRAMSAPNCEGSGRTPVAGKRGGCPAGEETAGHKKEVKRARGAKNWGAGHKKGVKRAREW